MFPSRMFWRLFGAYAGLLLAAIGILGFILADRFHRYYHHQVNERLRTRVLLVKELSRDWPAGKMQFLQERITRLGEEIATRITLIAPDGRVIADSDEDPGRMENHANRPEVQEAHDRGFGSATRYSDTLNKAMKYYALRLEAPTNPIGYVRIALSVEDIEEQLAGLNRIVWTGAGTTAVGAMLLALWLARRITSPLQELTKSSQRIAAGKFGHKVYAVGQDEVGSLARTFNYMSQQLALQFSQLEEDRQQLRTILSSMVEGVIAVDAEERVLFANDRAGQLLGYRPQSAVGRKLWEITRHPGLRDLVKRALEGPEDCEGEVTSEGPVAKSLTIQAARLPGNPIRGVLLVLHDTSELRRLERLRQEFVANVSHELKTPLSVIKACVETLLDGAMEDPQHRRAFMEQIAGQADRLHLLILDLLSLARIESSSEVYEYEPVSVEPLVTRCLERHHARAESKNQRLEAEPPSICECGKTGNIQPDDAEPSDSRLLPSTTAPVLAWADEDAFSQILDNLVDNALKYTPAGGRVCVRWRSEDGQVFLEVEDTGIGIPEADLPRIFERFYRVDKARSREMGGTGLGLSIVKHLVQAMKGSVNATSRVGGGTTFSVRLPRASAYQQTLFIDC
jgi:two-component system, OmpR family, phosphate regulon sensor histidine kinase PhoR